MRKKSAKTLKMTVSVMIMTVGILILMGSVVVALHMTDNTDVIYIIAAWNDRGAPAETAQLGSFAPQEVVTHQQQGDWALIHTIYGEGRVYMSADILYTQSTMGLFDEIDDTVQPPIHILEEFMEQFGNTVSVYYENLATGFIFRHNADMVYFGASATKAPFALYIYLKAERGETVMTDVHAFTADDNWGGSGVIRHRYNFGATFTQRQLLHLMLSPSDNIATRILRRVHGLEGYTQFVESIGANPGFVQNLTYSYLSANDAGIFMRETYRYIMSGGTYSQELKDNLLANRYPFIISDYPVASKSGWSASFGQAWHDMAIVFAPSPYVLALLSSRVGGAGDRMVYDSISRFIQEFNSAWFYPGETVLP
ncbi:MAG: class A beta-lactamase-related serine hydrolase [Firmicutes bacterium]|nr:class A beta-lactamase-related serine hydrolase [Bacillota bacterium]